MSSPRLLSLVMVSLVLSSSCGGSGGSASVEQTGANAFHIAYGSNDANGDFLDVVGLENGSSNFTYYDASKGYLQIRLQQRADAEQNGFGVGPFNGLYAYAPPGSSANSTAMAWYVDEWSFTGNGVSPVRIAGRTDPRHVAAGATEKLEIKWEHRVDCSHNDKYYGLWTCGGEPLKTRPDISAPVSAMSGAKQCPAEIVSEFVGGVGATASYRYPTTVSFAGAKASVSCVSTRGGQSVQCGIPTRVIKSGSCEWKAQALIAPHFNAQTSKQMLEIWIGATTDSEACASQRACNVYATVVGS